MMSSCGAIARTASGLAWTGCRRIGTAQTLTKEKLVACVALPRESEPGRNRIELTPCFKLTIRGAGVVSPFGIGYSTPT